MEEESHPVNREENQQGGDNFDSDFHDERDSEGDYESEGENDTHNHRTSDDDSDTTDNATSSGGSQEDSDSDSESNSYDYRTLDDETGAQEEFYNKNKYEKDEVDNKVIEKEMSIYRIDNSKFGIPDEFDGSIEDLEDEIEKRLKTKKVWCHRFEYNECKPFYLYFCTYQSKSPDPVTKIASQRKASQTDYKSRRQTGCIIVFYRLTDGKPEVFFLCSGKAYSQILSYVDVSFRTEMIKHYLNESNIKSIEYYKLTGNEVKTTIIFRTNIEKWFQQFDYFEKIITTVSGEIEEESNLSRLLRPKQKPEEGNTLDKGKTDQKKAIRIDFGAFKVKICMNMKCCQWANVLAMISEEITVKGRQEISETQHSIIEAFESVQKITNSEVVKRFEKRVINVVSNNTDVSDLHLSYKDPAEFTLSSSFVLKIKVEEKYANLKKYFHKESGQGQSMIQESPHNIKKVPKRQGFETLKFWGSSPLLEEVIKCLHKMNSAKEIKRAMEDGLVKITFGQQANSKTRPCKLQDLVHGTVDFCGNKYFKLNQRWYKLSHQYNKILKKRFKGLLEIAALREEDHEDIISILKYPWLAERAEFSTDVLKEILNIEMEQAEKLVTILKMETTFYEDGRYCLTKNDNMYLLPSDHKFVTKLQNEVPKETERKDKKESILQKALGYLWKLSKGEEKIKTNMQKWVKQDLLILKATEHNVYQVENPILSASMEQRINNDLPSIDISDLLSCLRSLGDLAERDYNELYVHSNKTGYEVLVGDRVLAFGKVELFDILIHDEKKRTTYLFHNKDGFNHKIREACSQIHVSSQVLWKDYLSGKQSYVEAFWKAGTSRGSESVYRQQVRKRLESLGRERLMSFFGNDVTLVFVLGFRDSGKDRYDLLRKPGRVLSTIAKIELLALDEHFSKYRMGGMKKFQLKLFQFKSAVGKPDTKGKERNTKQKGKQRPKAFSTGASNNDTSSDKSSHQNNGKGRPYKIKPNSTVQGGSQNDKPRKGTGSKRKRLEGSKGGMLEDATPGTSQSEASPSKNPRLEDTY